MLWKDLVWLYSVFRAALYSKGTLLKLDVLIFSLTSRYASKSYSNGEDKGFRLLQLVHHQSILLFSRLISFCQSKILDTLSSMFSGFTKLMKLSGSEKLKTELRSFLFRNDSFSFKSSSY
jgi:hypothetical protein